MKKNMEKNMGKKILRWTYPLWVKILLALLCAFSMIALVVSTAGTVFYRTGRDYEDELNAKYENTAMNYSAYVLDQINDGWSTERVQENMEKTAPNFKYAVVASGEEKLSDVDFSDPNVWLIGSSADQKNYRWTFRGNSKQTFNYSLDDIFARSLMSTYAYGYAWNEEAEELANCSVEQVCYDPESGIFYLDTEYGLYPVGQVTLFVKTVITDDILQSLVDEGFLDESYVEAAGDFSGTVACENIQALESRLLSTFAGISSEETEKGTVIYGFLTISGKMNEEGSGYDYYRSDDESDTLYTPDGWDLSALALQDWEEVSMVDSAGHVSESLSREEKDKFAKLSQGTSAGVILDGSYAVWNDGADMSSIDLGFSDTDTIHYWVLSWQADPLDETADDLFAQWSQVLPVIYDVFGFCLPVQIISLILLFVGIISLGCGVGHRSSDDEIHIRFWEKIPYLIWICIVGTLESIAVLGLALISEEAGSIGIGNAILFDCEIALAAILLGEEFVASTVVRIKAKCFWRYTVCHYLMRPFKALKVQAEANMPLFWQIIIILGAWSLFEILVVMLSWTSWSRKFQFFWLVLLLAAQTAALLIAAMQMARLYDASKKIAAGDINHPVDTSKLYWKFKEQGENLNHISDAIDTAVQREMKSEHFQTELITNVSHDIKTPLTSIINYVDLMKKEEITDPTLAGYVEVLDRQSGKLKKLIEDLMEASKASTGNMTVNLEETDAAILLEQAVGEFSERLEKSGLHVVVTGPEPPVTIIADGRHLWRVFDNLLSNICKYAMEGTRVYITLAQEAGGTDIIFRNISANELNISSEELMARFVRGDASRSTEGSGLGLNIAQSLMRLMNGSLKLEVDGDLFKVTLHFPENSQKASNRKDL